MTAKSVLFVHAADEAYGADRILLSQMTGLGQRGWDVRLILPDDVEPGWLSAAAEDAGIPTERLALAVARRRYLRPAGLPGYLVAIARARGALRSAIRRDRPAIVHINTSALLVGAVLGRPSGVRLVWQIHEIVVRPRPMAWLFRIVPMVTADRVIAVSDAVRRHLLAVSHRPSRIVTIRNGIPARVPDPLPALTGEDGPLVAYVGRLNRWKGYELFVEAVAHVAPQFPAARFVMAGDPPPGEAWRTVDLADRIHLAGLDGRIRPLGFVAGGAAVFDAADIAVVPSTWPDPFPTVILEAMRAGCAVIAADHGGASEMIDAAGGGGLLVPPGDAAALADAIATLLGDADRRAAMGAAARRRVGADFTTDRMVDQLERLYADVLR